MKNAKTTEKIKDIAEFNIRKKHGSYYDLCQDSLVNKGIKKLTDNQFIELSKKFRLRFNLTSQCNLWCIFCSNEGSAYSTKGQRSLAKIDLITKLSDILIKNTLVQSIEFSGGEPTIHPDFTTGEYKLIKWTKKHPQVKFAIHSNGIMLTPVVIDQIKDNFAKIGLSIHSVNFETWNKTTNLKNYLTKKQQLVNFQKLMKNIDYLSKCKIGNKVFIKSVVIRGINDSEKELRDLLEFCAQKGFHPKFFEFEPQYKEQEKYVVDRKELFGKLEKLGCKFTSDTPKNNSTESYIPSVNFDYKTEEGTPRGLHSIFGCGDPGACKSCYINLPFFIKPTEDCKGLYIKPCSPLDTRFDLTWAIENGDHKQVLDIFKMSREYLMLTPGLGINGWNKEEKYKIDFIDWNGTLSTSKFWGHLENSGGDNKEKFIKIENILFGQLRNLIKPWMRGEVTSEDVISEISAKSGLKYNDIFDEFVKSCQRMNYVSKEVIPLISKLRRLGSKTIIATDNMDSFIRWTVPSLKLSNVFDKILDSYTLKAMKNDFDEINRSLFFNTFFENNDFDPKESVLIDDSEDKDNRIQSYGIDYLKIAPGEGLVPALKSLIEALSPAKSNNKTSLINSG